MIEEPLTISMPAYAVFAEIILEVIGSNNILLMRRMDKLPIATALHSIFSSTSVACSSASSSGILRILTLGAIRVVSEVVFRSTLMASKTIHILARNCISVGLQS